MATGLRAPNGLTTGPDDAIYVSDNPFSGKMLHTSFGAAAMSAVFEQRVGDVSQAAAVKLPLKPFDSGIMRARFGADGAVYVCGVKGWQSKAVRDGCIARVRYTGQPAPLAVAWRVEKDMMFVAFDIALQPAAAADSQNWSLEQWNYQWHSKYGSQDVSIADPKKVGRDTVDIRKRRRQDAHIHHPRPPPEHAVFAERKHPSGWRSGPAGGSRRDDPCGAAPQSPARTAQRSFAETERGFARRSSGDAMITSSFVAE